MTSFPNLSWPTDRPLRAICLDGGGYLGLATATFLAELERHLRIKIADLCDLFCGTSTGGIIALALAKGMPAAEIADLYNRLGKEVFPSHFGSRPWRFVRGLFAARYSNENLKKALGDTFGDTKIKDVAARKKFLVVPTFCLTTGSPRIFKTDHSPELSAHGDYYLRDIALATSAAPTYFPIVAIRSPTSAVIEQFIDGGVFANNPTLLALTEALGYLNVPAQNIAIASVATPRDNDGLAKPVNTLHRHSLNRGALRWMPGLANLFIGSNMQVTHSAVNRLLMGLAGTLNAYERFELRSAPKLGLDIATQDATNTLMAIGSSAGQATEIRSQFQRFLGRNNGQRTEAV